MKYIAIGMCIAIMICYLGTNVVVADYRNKKDNEFDYTFVQIESYLKESYYEIMNQTEDERDKMDVWKSAIRWNMNQRSELYGKKYVTALYEKQTKEKFVETKKIINIVYRENINDKEKKARIYECPLEIMQSALDEYDKKCAEFEDNYRKEFAEDTIGVRLVIQDVYIKNGQFIPGRVLLIQTDSRLLEEEQETVIGEYDFTPENSLEYEHIMIEGNEKARLLGPVWFEFNGRERVNALLKDYVENDEEVWQYSNMSNGYLTFWGNEQTRHSSITLGENLEYKLVMAGEADLFDDYGTWIVLIYAGMLLFTIIISVGLAYRTYMLRFNHYQLDTYRRETTNAMAHDLKTPLMAISGYAENLRANVHSEKKDYYADTILEHVKYMNEMVGNILELAKVENVEWVLEKEDVNLKYMTEDILKKYEILTLDKKLRVAIEGECVIRADNSLMKQAIENLIGNAMKYAAEDTEIQIKIAEGVYEIRNTIDGALDTSVEELWKPFVKGDNCRNNQKGTGIGLTIVKNIVEAHGFELSLQCEEQEFVVRLLF